MHSSGRARRAAAALVCLALAATGTTACSGPDGPEQTLDAFLDGWRGGDLSKVGFVTAAGGRISAEETYGQIQALAGDLAKSSLLLSKQGDPAETGDIASGPIKLDWTLPGGASWSYQSTVRLTKAGSDGWRVVWEPAIVHSELTDGDRLELRRKAADRADIQGPDGKPIVTQRPITVIGVSPEQIPDRDKLLKELAAELRKIDVELDLKDLTARIEGSKPDAFVDVITLREADFAKVRTRVLALEGTLTREDVSELAPSRAFARASLGTVSAATRDDLDANPQTLAQGDQVGHGGLQQRYDTQLRGTPGQSVVIARKTPDDKVVDAQIFSIEPIAGKPIRTTLDIRTQEAADRAIAGVKQPSALVAIRISDSAVVAVANGPNGGGADTALTGQVPPGSTWKMVSALGLLDKKAITLDGRVDCPKTKTVNGRKFKNAHDMALGSVPFRTDFAQSCNTAFVNLAPQLGADGLQDAAAKLGLGAKWDLGADSFSGKVSPADSPTELAAASFGQGATAVSPVALAGAAATVARGQFKQPRLVLDPAPPNALPDGSPLAATSVEPLRTVMREVITKGTATALRTMPGGPVHGKTGTAEFANGSEETHAWFIGWQDDLAFAVLVEKGGSGEGTAVPIVKDFLNSLRK
ncbi:penicillin-binding transpeptidase domain-containing protein [Actinoplanes sp. NPDC051859]|uniref:penicillin-binding transpeptidase domain-containing protein n=1 Tax=Actinoplanes sp. NPDC051859 TaxID=3363909 RepID=UPI0037A18836